MILDPISWIVFRKVWSKKEDEICPKSYIYELEIPSWSHKEPDVPARIALFWLLLNFKVYVEFLAEIYGTKNLQIYWSL